LEPETKSEEEEEEVSEEQELRGTEGKVVISSSFTRLLQLWNIYIMRKFIYSLSLGVHV